MGVPQVSSGDDTQVCDNNQFTGSVRYWMFMLWREDSLQMQLPTKLVS